MIAFDTPTNDKNAVVTKSNDSGTFASAAAALTMRFCRNSERRQSIPARPAQWKDFNPSIALVARDLLGHAVQSDDLLDERTSCRVVPFGAQQDVDRVTVHVNRPVQVLLLTGDFDAGLVNSPTVACPAACASESPPPVSAASL